MYVGLVLVCMDVGIPLQKWMYCKQLDGCEELGLNGLEALKIFPGLRRERCACALGSVD